MIRFVFLSVLIRASFCQMSSQPRQCPVMQRAMQQSISMLADVRAKEDSLARVRSDDVGNVFFNQPAYPQDAANDFNRTFSCLVAEQLFAFGGSPGCSLSTLAQHSSCLPLDQRCSTMSIESCPKDSRFRSITGACNNQKNQKWGKSFTPFGRLQSANYANGLLAIRKSVIDQVALPAATVVTNAIKKNPFTCDPDRPANHGSVMFGQLMAHDHGMRQMHQQQGGGFTRTCCNEDYTKPLSPLPFGCHTFEYAKDDPFLNQASPNSNIRCMNYIRSEMVFPNDCSLGPAQPVNLVSHYLDLSPVYGNDEQIAKDLRTFQNGLLKTNKNNVLPETCDDPTRDCYLTGDNRGTAFFVLGILQSKYHRFHNIVARILKTLNPKWNDERIYQEARRINIAVYQNHVIDWLRVFVGDNEVKKFLPVRNEYVGRYNPNVDASSTTEFSHCVFRVFHSNLADKFRLINENNEIIKTMELDECDGGLKILETDFDNVCRGMIFTPSSHSSYSPKIRHQMFNDNNKFNLGIDLIATDLFVGRDVGVQPYHVYFKLCTGKTVKSWDDLKDTIPAEAVADLRNVYKSVLDVDTFAALALETKCGSYLGTVGKCLTMLQYERTITGDRHWYSLPNGAYPFTPSQLDTIYKFSYGDFICTVTNVLQVPRSAFEIPSRKNPMVTCNGGINLSAWKDQLFLVTVVRLDLDESNERPCREIYLPVQVHYPLYLFFKFTSNER